MVRFATDTRVQANGQAPSGFGRLLAQAWDRWSPGGVLVSRNAAENRNPANYSPALALQIAPIWSAVTLLADAFAVAELRVLDEMGKQVKMDLPVWADPDLRPNQDQSHVDLRRHVGMSYLVGANAYLQILNREGGYPSSIVSIPPDEAAPTWIKGVSPNTAAASYQITYNGIQHVPYSSARVNGSIFHLRWFTLESRVLGVSPLERAAPPLRTALAAEATAELYFASGGLPPSILSYKDSGAGATQMDELVEHYKEIRRRPEMAHIPLPIEGDVQWLSTYIAPEQAQLLDSRKFTWHSAASIYHVHPALLAGPQTAATLAGYREIRRDHREGTQQRFLDAMSMAFTELLPPGLRVHFRPGEPALPPLEKSRYYERLLKMRVITPAEVRAQLGYPEHPEILDELPSAPMPLEDGGDSDSAKDDGTNQDGSEEGGSEDEGDVI